MVILDQAAVSIETKLYSREEKEQKYEKKNSLKANFYQTRRLLGFVLVDFSGSIQYVCIWQML